MTKIGVAIIAKNEEGTIEAAARSVAPFVDIVHLVDTGSTDATVEKFLEVGSNCFAEKVGNRFAFSDGKISSFSDARNYSFDALFSKIDVDWIVWMDADDEIENFQSLKSYIHALEQKISSGDISDNATYMVCCPYNYAFDPSGNVIVRHVRERAFRVKGNARHRFRWKMPVHEFMDCDATGENHNVICLNHEETVWNHRKQFSTSKEHYPERNLRILKEFALKQTSEGKMEPRTLFYLGQENFDLGNLQEAESWYKKYLEVSSWSDEKYMAHMKLIHISCVLYGQTSEQTLYWIRRAIDEKPAWSEAHYHLCRYYYNRASCEDNSELASQLWQMARLHGQYCVDAPMESTAMFLSPLIRNVEVHRYLNVAHWHCGDLDAAEKSAQSALKCCPDDSGLKSNIELYSKKKALTLLEESCRKIVESGFRGPEFMDEVRKILEKSPDVTQEYKEQKQNATLVQTPANGKTIYFYVGRHAGAWDYKSLDKGLGGSETAVVHMARLFALRGYKVSVYGNPSEQTTISPEGVRYLHMKEFANAVKPDIMIASRSPEAIEINPGKKNYLWVHDVHCGNTLTVQRSYLYDGIFCLSDWHLQFMKSSYPHNRKDNYIQTRNGIDLSRFKNSEEKRLNRAIYSSSPDRGLEVAIRTWPKVREEVPDAELHVYYGFDNWIQPDSPEDMVALANKIKNLMQNTPGVVYHGKTSQKELAEDMMKAKVWYYPTWFSETSCISAMEAQAAGLKIVTSPIAALKETVKGKAVFVEGDWLDEDYQNRAVGAVVHFLKSEDKPSFPPVSFAWDGVCDQWDEIFNTEERMPEFL